MIVLLLELCGIVSFSSDGDGVKHPNEEAEEEGESCLIDGKPEGARGLAERGRFHIVSSEDCTFDGIVWDC